MDSGLSDIVETILNEDNYFSVHKKRKDAGPKNYRKNTGHNGILLKDDDNRRAIIIEAKKSDRESDLDKDSDEAIRQIVTEKYADGLHGYEQVLCYGVAFFKKQAKVKMLSS